MDEKLLTRALKYPILKQLLGLYLLSLETGKHADRTTLLTFAKGFDKEEGSNLSPFIKTLKPDDVETLIQLYREDTTLEALQSPALTPVSAPAQPKAPGAQTLRTHPTPAPRTARGTPVEPAAKDDDIPNWLREMQSDEDAEPPAAKQTAPKQTSDALPRVTKSDAEAIAEHYEAMPPESASPTHYTGTAVLTRNPKPVRPQIYSRLPAFDRKTTILIGVMIIGLIAGFAAIGLVISNQAKPPTTPDASSQNATPPAGPGNPLTAPTAAIPVPTRQQQVAPAYSGYDWQTKFDLPNQEVEAWRTRCNLSPNQANDKLTQLRTKRPPAVLAEQIKGPCP